MDLFLWLLSGAVDAGVFLWVDVTQETRRLDSPAAMMAVLLLISGPFALPSFLLGWAIWKLLQRR